MVSRRIILKALDDSITKCSNSSKKARERGSQYVRKDNSDGGYTLTYSDGTTIEFNKNGLINSCNINDKSHSFLGDKCYEEFRSQDDYLKKQKGFDFVEEHREYDTDERGILVNGHQVQSTVHYENGYEFMLEYANLYATFMGREMNDMLFEDKPLYTEPSSSVAGKLVFNKDAHDYFQELEENNTFSPSSNILSVRYTNLHEGDNVEKKTVSYKGHTSTSVGGTEDLTKIFTDEYQEDSWTVITTIGANEKVNGLFFGNLLNDYRVPQGGENDWEGELNFPPKTKFTRDLIDEENHIIIQHIGE